MSSTRDGSTPAALATGCARAFVDELVRGGVRHACASPGSRSTPLLLAAADDPRVALHVALDERSAGFLALGIGAATRRPAAVVCTSGSATTHLHPAIVEARHGRVPLLALTADRPPELLDTGAPQTIDQVGLYGRTPRWAAALGPPDPTVALAATAAHWRSVAARAVAEAVGPPAGPVHVNVGLREPLLADGPVPDLAGAPGGRPWVVTAPAVRTPAPGVVATLADLARRAERGVVVAGWGAAVEPAVLERLVAETGWPVLADPLSGLRAGAGVVSTYEAVLRVPGFAAGHRPDLVLRLGAPLTSKTATQWLDRAVRQVVVDPDGAWLDPERAASERVVAEPGLLVAALADALAGDPPARRDEAAGWALAWEAVEAGARAALDGLLDGWDEPTEPRVARDVVAGVPDGATLVVASSMPVRDVEWFARPRTGLRVLANRGTNGIDGFASTALGVALGTGGPVVGLTGDLAFLHDAGGLLGAAGRGVTATFVVVDNDGGGIFSFLAQGAPGAVDRFEELFGTPHGIDLAALAAVHGIPSTTVERADALVPAVRAGLAHGGVSLVLVRTDRADNVVRHRAAWTAVARALGAG